MNLVAYGLLRGASAFLAALGRRPLPPAPPPPVLPEAPQTPLSSGLRQEGIENRCPVCQARFRGARICSRCGADLEPLMRLTVKAWQLRQAARQAMDCRDVERSLALATEAQGVQGTGSGEALRLLGAWLKSEFASGM